MNIIYRESSPYLLTAEARRSDRSAPCRGLRGRRLRLKCGLSLEQPSTRLRRFDSERRFLRFFLRSRLRLRGAAGAAWRRRRGRAGRAGDRAGRGRAACAAGESSLRPASPCSTSQRTHMRGTMATPMSICTKRLMLSMVGISTRISQRHVVLGEELNHAIAKGRLHDVRDEDFLAQVGDVHAAAAWPAGGAGETTKASSSRKILTAASCGSCGTKETTPRSRR